MTRSLAALASALALAASGCSSKEENNWLCNPAAQTGCGPGQSCEYVGSIGAACFAPVLVAGAVLDAAGVTTLAGARVVALDASRAPVSSVGVSTTAGYELGVRAARDLSGRPVSTTITLRADAQGYETFPGGIRPALPIDLSSAVVRAGRWVVSSPLTTLRLVALAAGPRAAVHGSVARPPSGASPLVVAEPAAGGAGLTAIANRDGTYAIFNLPAGVSYVVTPYARGVNYVPSSPTGPLDPDTDTTIAPQHAVAGTPTASFDGGAIQKQQNPNPVFDVTLVVSSTYVKNLDRGDSPPGLTVAGSFGNPGYRFTGVPDGEYRVLAAFGLEGDVREESGTGNTESPWIVVSGGALASAVPGFKLANAVDLQTIEGVAVGVDWITAVPTTTPAFGWATNPTYSAAKTYRVSVFDALGNRTWTCDAPSVALPDPPRVRYGDTTPGVCDPTAAPALPLQAGEPYQLRIQAFEEVPLGGPPWTQLSQTEDLEGVFTYRP